MRFKLATPISHLFEDSVTAREIIASSDCLEGREERLQYRQIGQCIFHFEANIVRAWDAREKDRIHSIILPRHKLKVISFHILSSCSEPVLDGYAFQYGGRELSRQEMLDNARDNVTWLKSLVGEQGITIAVENINYYPTPAYREVAEAPFIERIIRENGVSFLFDLAHARITAHNMKISYQEYKAQLPLDRMVQIHVSKYAVNDEGLAYDAHELPDDEIFREVKEIVRTSSPEYVTIEYYKDKDNLIKMLERYRGICAEPNEVRT